MPKRASRLVQANQDRVAGERTFSGGEGLAYVLQQHGRATVVGERTGGGAHSRIGIRLHPHLELALPTGRAFHPTTGLNWEGVGVQPDTPAPATDALSIAHDLARTTDPATARHG